MNICGHIIEDDQVIGIGPLMVKETDSSVQASLYNSRQLLFKVYLKSFEVEIESEFFKVGHGASSNERETAARARYEDFEPQYNKIKEIITKKVKVIKWDQVEYVGSK